MLISDIIQLEIMVMNRLKIYCFAVIVSILILSGCAKQSPENEISIAENLLSLAEKDYKPDSKQYLALVDSAFYISQRLDYTDGIVKSISMKGSYYYASNSFEEALQHFNEAIELAQTSGNKILLGNAYDQIAMTYNRLKRKEESLSAFKEAINAKTQTEDSTGLGQSLNNLGFIYWQSSQFDSAVIYFDKAYIIRMKLSNKSEIATTANNLGTIYYQWAIYDRALEYFLQALKLQKEIGNLKNASLVLCNIGLVYKETSHIQKAKEYYFESLAIALKENAANTIAYAYHCIGATFLTTNIDSATYYFKKSLDAYRENAHIGGEILALKGIGESFLRLNEYRSAEKYFNNILKLAVVNDIPLRKAEAYNYLGEINKKENKLKKAIEYFQKSVAISDELNLKVISRESYKSLSEIYEAAGEINKALISLKKFEDFEKSIADENMERRLADLKNKFEVEKYQRNLEAQQHENEKQKIYLFLTFLGIFFLIVIAVILLMLNRKIKKTNGILSEKNNLIEGQSMELNLRNEKLMELNESKDKLFSIIAHDLKNPFFALISFSTLLKEEYPRLNDSEKKEYIGYIEMTSKKTYELLENLLSLSASRTGKIEFNQVEIELAELTNNVIDLFNSQLQNKQITISNKIDENISIYADPYMFETVMRNLINNAIKYSNRHGNIEITAVESEQETHIVVKDEGIGISPNYQDDIFKINFVHSKLGTNGEKGTGLGLGLCKEFIEKNGGNISVESELGKGSEFHIYLPKSFAKTNLVEVQLNNN
jgi:signal transduction histidine kinase